MADVEAAVMQRQLARAARVTVPEDVRQRLNGETVRLMQHLKKVKERDAGKPTTEDQPWPVDCSFIGADIYAVTVTLLWAIKPLVLLPLVFLACIPGCIFLRLVMVCVPTPTETLRSRGLFRPAMLISHLLFLPLLLLMIFSLFVDYAFFYLFGCFWCALTCGWCRWRRSLKVIAPYQGGPSVWLHSTDFFTSLAGQLHRRGVLKILVQLSNTVVVVPWVKYWFHANPLLYNLEERFLNQVGAPVRYHTEQEQIVAVRLFSEAKLPKEQSEAVSKFHFCPHYCFPPPERRWHIGTQSHSKSIFHVLMVVHSTHAQSSHGGSTEQLVLSNECSHPGYRVMLWYNNPFHPFTGYVEANGQKSWSDGQYRLEHPMWIVSCHSPLECTHKFGPMDVDDLFTYDVVPTIQAAMEGELQSNQGGNLPNMDELEGNLPGAVPE